MRQEHVLNARLLEESIYTRDPPEQGVTRVLDGPKNLKGSKRRSKRRDEGIETVRDTNA